MDTNTNTNLPFFWEILSADDQSTYMKISNALGAPTLKNKRNTKIDSFADAIEAIDIFQNHCEDDKWRRYLVCGLFKFDGGIAVNINQLKKLVRKCKTSINTSLKGMGYTIISGKSSECPELLQAIPCLRGNSAELRQWTVRYLEEGRNEYNKRNDEYVTPPESMYGVDEPQNQQYSFALTVNDTTNNFNTQTQTTKDSEEYHEENFFFDDVEFEQFAQWEDTSKYSDTPDLDNDIQTF